jgi:uncharacterized protein YcfJ
MNANARLKFAACAALATAAMLAPSMAPASRVVTLSSGTNVTASMNQTIDSGSAQTGQHFTMTVVPPYPQSSSAFSGATLYGHVTKVVPAGQGTNPEIAFAIDRMVLRNGDVGSPYLVVNAEQTQRHDNTAKVAIGALAGMVVGNWLGKAVFNSNAGGTVGAIAGALYASNNRTNVSLRQGSQVVFESRRTVALR